MFSSKKVPPQWQADSLLNSRLQSPNFVRTHWDASKAHQFGPWRLNAESDPTDGLNKEFPQDSKEKIDAEELEDNAESQEERPLLLSSDSESSQDSDAIGNTELKNKAANTTSGIQSAQHSEMNEQQLNVARQQGYVQGLRDGMSKTLSDLESERNKDKDIIDTLIFELESTLKDSFRNFEPLKKLSLHIAEQLVRGELSLSGIAIERLIRACIAELNTQEKFVTVSANPHDLERVKRFIKDSGSEIILQPDQNLLSGSIRVRSNDTVIEDLIENRLEGLARQLISEPDVWLQNASGLAGSKVEIIEPVMTELAKSNNDQVIDDVQEKPTASPTNNEEVQ